MCDQFPFANLRRSRFGKIGLCMSASARLCEKGAEATWAVITVSTMLIIFTPLFFPLLFFP